MTYLFLPKIVCSLCRTEIIQNPKIFYCSEPEGACEQAGNLFCYHCFTKHNEEHLTLIEQQEETRTIQ